MHRTKKLTLCAVFSALALISFILEGLFPPLFIPGARLGVSNVFILLAIFVLGKSYGYVALTVKIVLGSIFAGNPSAMLYSLPAGIISVTIEILFIYRVKKLSVVSISAMGSVINLIVQNTVFCLVTGGTEYFVYLPYLALIGGIAGIFVGFAVYLILRFFPQNIFSLGDTEDKI